MTLSSVKSFLAKVISYVPEFVLRQILDLFVKSLNLKTDVVYTYNERPQILGSFQGFYEDSYLDDVGIIVQGPYVTESGFTLKTLLLYRKFYPQKTIVLSTWKDQIPQTDRHLLENNCIVTLENSPPEQSGTLNINLQLRTTNQALAWMDKNRSKIKFVLKTRTDQRIYLSNLFSYLSNLQDLLGSQNQLTALAFNSKRGVLGSISDMFIFGKVQNVKKYFSVQEQDFTLTRDEYFFQAGKYLNPEQIFFKNYVGQIPAHDEAYKDLVSRYFFLIDKEQVDLYWNKYSRIENKKIYNTRPEERYWSFSEYLELLCKRSN